MKNPEHESGYFEDGSDVEIIGESDQTSAIGARGIKWNVSGGSAGSCSLAKAINELDVSDSPASPTLQTVNDSYEERRNRGKNPPRLRSMPDLLVDNIIGHLIFILRKNHYT